MTEELMKAIEDVIEYGERLAREDAPGVMPEEIAALKDALRDFKEAQEVGDE